jgi:hypothetical protein
MNTFIIETKAFNLKEGVIDIKFDACKFLSYGLAKAIYWKETEYQKEYADILSSRYFPYIKQGLELLQLQKEKPHYQQKREFETYVSAFQNIYRNNIELIVKKIINKDLKRKMENDGKPYHDNFMINGKLHELSSKETDELLESKPWHMPWQKKIKTDRQLLKNLKTVNSANFDKKMYQYIDFLLSSDMMVNLCSDYIQVQSIMTNPKRFKELEQKCQYQLYDFVNAKAVKGLDRDSQYQEGLLALWVAGKNYEARNFARFTTFAKAALHFKFCNLLTFSLADKRKINRIASPMGLTTSSSTFVSSEIDRLSCYAWDLRNREAEKLPEEVGTAIRDTYYGIGNGSLEKILNGKLSKDNFQEIYHELVEFCENETEIIPFSDLFELQSNKRGDMVAGTKEYISDVENFPHLNEEKLQLMDSNDYSEEWEAMRKQNTSDSSWMISSDEPKNNFLF